MVGRLPRQDSKSGSGTGHALLFPRSICGPPLGAAQWRYEFRLRVRPFKKPLNLALAPVCVALRSFSA